MTRLQQAKAALRRRLQPAAGAAPPETPDWSVLLQATLDALRDRVAVLDMQGRVLSLNRAWRQGAEHAVDLHGQPLVAPAIGDDHIAGLRRLQAAGDSEAGAMADGIQAVLQGERTLYTQVYASRSMPGAWFELAATPLPVAQGGAVLVHSDRSEAQNAQRALRESEAVYRSMASAVDEAVVVFDRHGLIQACNARAEDFFGATLAQLQRPDALTQWQPVRADGSPMPVDEWPLRQTLRTGQPCRDVLVGLRRPNGLQHWLMTRAEPVCDADGALTAVVVSFSDVTERHHTEERLRKLSMAVEQSPISVLIINNGNGVIEYANSAWTKISGYSRDETLGHRRRALQPDPEPEANRVALLADVKSGQPWRGVLRCVRKNGERYDELIHAAPIRQADERITHYLLMGEDITEKQRLGAELDAHRHHLQDLVEARTQALQRVNAELALAREQAEAASQAKGAFLARLGYDARDLSLIESGQAPRSQPAPGQPVSQPDVDHIPGLDLPRALRGMGGRVDLMRRVLQQFVSHFAPGQVDLPACVLRGDFQGAAELAHSVKGAALAIGELRLPGLADSLRAEVQRQAPQARLLQLAQDMQQALTAVCAAIEHSAFLAPSAVVLPAVASPALEQPALEQPAAQGVATPAEWAEFERLLLSSDFRALRLFNQLAPRLRLRPGPALDEMASGLRGFDFERALGALPALRREQGV